MSPRQTAKENGKKYYMTFCRKCKTETEHRVLNYTCKPCAITKSHTPDAIAKKKKWNQDNKKKVSIYYAQYNQDNIERLSTYRIQYYLNNKEQRKDYNKKYNILPKVKKRRNELKRKHYHEDPVFRMKHILSSTVWHFCKVRGETKENKTHKLLGYSAEECKIHIESLFKDGMTWDNQGKNGGWEIDHRIPQSYFTSIDQLKECFALENLKPEWADWNRSKGNRFIG